MKTLSEVVEITGISRRVLQGYKEIGFILPANIEEIESQNPKQRKTKWLYDDNTVNALMIIHMLSEIGYTRDQIVNMILYPSKKKSEYLKEAIADLDKKRRRIEAEMIVADMYMVKMRVVEKVTSQCKRNNESDDHSDLSTEPMSNATDQINLLTGLKYEDYLLDRPAMTLISFIWDLSMFDEKTAYSPLAKKYISVMSSEYLNILFQRFPRRYSANEKNKMAMEKERIPLFAESAIKEISGIFAQNYDIASGKGKAAFVKSMLEYYKNLYRK